ncbi:MAG: response regulator [Zetaproteobacteria bacterium]|nr:response regulator [Zetaproteobacteria bacterium]
MANILIVDDSEMFRQELRDTLNEGGHRIIESADGLEGLQKAKESQDIDIIISDFNMPGMNGIEMVRLIKDLPKYETTPVFILTTETSPELKKYATQAGVMAWIVKPFVPEKLLLGIRKVLNSSQHKS